MQRKYAGQQVGEADDHSSPQMRDDGCEYCVEQMELGDKFYFIPLYRPNEDITAEYRYFLKTSVDRFANLMGYFFHDANADIERCTRFSIDEINLRLKEAKNSLGMNLSNPHFKKNILVELFALNAARLIKLSEMRIELNAEYCGLMPSTQIPESEISENTRTRFVELYRQNKELAGDSAEAFQELQSLKREKFFNLKPAMITEPGDIDNLLYEAVSEIFKIPQFHPVSLEHNSMPVRESFVPQAIKRVVLFVYTNRLQKTTDACACIDAVGTKLLAAAEKFSVEEYTVNKISEAITTFVAAARAKTAVAVRDSEFPEVDRLYNDAAANLDMEINKIEGFAGKASPVKAVIETGLEIIDRMVATKRPFSRTAAKFIAAPLYIRPPGSEVKAVR